MGQLSVGAQVDVMGVTLTFSVDRAKVIQGRVRVVVFVMSYGYAFPVRRVLSPEMGIEILCCRHP